MGVIGTAAADGSGNWSYDYTGTPLADGCYPFAAVATDAAGNVSSDSPPFSVVVDTMAPTASVPDLAALSDTGRLDDDNITQGTNPQFSGTAGDDRSGLWKLVVTSNDGKMVADSDAPFYNVTLATLYEGNRTVTATAYDLAGNTYTTSALAVTVDRTVPTGIALSQASTPENQPSGTTVGTFSTTDPDAEDAFTYSLVAGTGSDDNAMFTINGNTLQTAVGFDFELPADADHNNMYSMLVRTTDRGGLWYEELLTINVTNVNEAPTQPSRAR